MPHRIAFEFTSELAQTAMRRFLRKFLLPEMTVIVLALTLAWIAYYVGGVADWLLLSIVIASILLAIVSPLAAWRYVHQASTKLKSMTDRTVEWTFTDETVGTRSELGTSELKWKVITKIWRFPEVWLLFFGNSGYSTLPTAVLTDELKAYIADRVVANGGKVT